MRAPRIYLDYAATSPVRPEAREAAKRFLGESFGNPSSLHGPGREARAALENARDLLLRLLGQPPGDLVFTGSGTEADNLAILGYSRADPDSCIVRSAVEHKAVMESTRALAESGYDVREIPVDEHGVVRLDALQESLPEDGRPTLVSVMWANNETGVVQPIREVARICRERGAVLHSDAVQAFGKVPIDLSEVGVDLLAISAHKIGGVKGAGALFVREGIDLQPIVYGGGQESGLRSGTEAVPAIAAFAAAAQQAVEQIDAEAERLGKLRDDLETRLRRETLDLIVNGGDAKRLPNVLSVSVPGTEIEALLTSLDLEGICVSSGSACTTGGLDPSHVMAAMGRRGALASNMIRFSLGWGTDQEEVERASEVFPAVVRRVREFASRAGA